MALTDVSRPTDVAMLTDLYELTMAQGLWENGKLEERDCFTAFYRDKPFGSAYAVMCGTSDLPDLVENLRFTDEDIDYLASLFAPAGGRMFNPAFLEYLRGFRAHVDIDAVAEGDLVFPREPLQRVAPWLSLACVAPRAPMAAWPLPVRATWRAPQAHPTCLRVANTASLFLARMRTAG